MTRLVNLSFLSNAEFNRRGFTMTGYMTESEGAPIQVLLEELLLGFPLLLTLHQLDVEPVFEDCTHQL